MTEVGLSGVYKAMVWRIAYGVPIDAIRNTWSTAQGRLAAEGLVD